MLKILYLMDRLDWGDKTAGTEAQFLQLVTNLDRERFEPHLAVFRPTPFTSQPNRLPIPVHLLGIGKLMHPQALSRLAQLGRMVRRSVARYCLARAKCPVLAEIGRASCRERV